MRQRTKVDREPPSEDHSPAHQNAKSLPGLCQLHSPVSGGSVHLEHEGVDGEGLLPEGEGAGQEANPVGEGTRRREPLSVEVGTV